eukprot:269287-Pyramimonas_sp.AAC.1
MEPDDDEQLMDRPGSPSLSPSPISAVPSAPRKKPPVSPAVKSPAVQGGNSASASKCRERLAAAAKAHRPLDGRHMGMDSKLVATGLFPRATFKRLSFARFALESFHAHISKTTDFAIHIVVFRLDWQQQGGPSPPEGQGVGLFAAFGRCSNSDAMDTGTDNKE